MSRDDHAGSVLSPSSAMPCKDRPSTSQPSAGELVPLPYERVPDAIDGRVHAVDRDRARAMFTDEPRYRCIARCGRWVIPVPWVRGPYKVCRRCARRVRGGVIYPPQPGVPLFRELERKYARPAA